MNYRLTLLLLLPALTAAGLLPKRKKAPPLTPLEEYVASVRQTPEGSAPVSSPGSAYVPGGRLSELARDFRAGQAGDLITIVVIDRANAVSTAGAGTQLRHRDLRHGSAGEKSFAKWHDV